MLLFIKGLEIHISKGDSEDIPIDFEEDVPPDDTLARVTLKRYPNNAQEIWRKDILISDGSITLSLNSEDTNLTPGVYKYDIRLKYPNGEWYTPMKPADFCIEEVVGDADNN